MNSAFAFRRFLLLMAMVGLCALLALSAACGDDDDDDDGGSEATTAAGSEETEEPTDEAAEPSETIEIELNNFSFTPAEFSVAAGETVKLQFTNNGSAPHNMRIAGPDGEFETDDDTVRLEVKSGGGAGSVDYTAPDEAGEIAFRCDFHPDQMTGTITIE